MHTACLCLWIRITSCATKRSDATTVSSSSCSPPVKAAVTTARITGLVTVREGGVSGSVSGVGWDNYCSRAIGYCEFIIFDG